VVPACNTGLGSFTPSIARISFCLSTGSIRKDSIQTLHIRDTTHQTLLVKTGNEQSAWSLHPQLRTLNSGVVIFFLHIIFICGRTYTTFICVYGICFWHHSHLLWSSLLSVFSSLDCLVPSQFPLSAAPFDSELFCVWLRGFLVSFQVTSASSPSHITSSPLDILLWAQLFSFVLLSFSTSAPSLAFISLSLPPPASFSRPSFRGFS